MTTYIYGANATQFTAYRNSRSGPARTVTRVVDVTTLVAATGSGHVIVYIAGYHSHPDASAIETQIKSMVDTGRATVRRDPVVG